MKTSFSTTCKFLAGLLLLGILQSCESSLDRIEDWEQSGPIIVSDEINQIVAPEGFDYETTADQEFIITAVLGGSTATPNVGVEVYDLDKDGDFFLLAKGATDESGIWQPTLSLAIDLDSVSVKVTTFGFPQWHRVAVQGGLTNYTLGADNSNGRIIEDPFPTEVNDTMGLSGNVLGARAGFKYMGNFDRDGVPSYLTTDGELDDSVLEFIATNLPGSGSVPETNPHYLEDGNTSSLVFKEDGELWLTFAHEGAGYQNSIGYFTFDPNDPPTKKNEIDERTVVFPNISYSGSGGGLKSGNRVYLGKFEAGTGVGWFLVPHGWNYWRGTVRDRSTTRYSIDELNTFAKEEYQKHMVLLTNNTEEFFVLGIEDLNRPSGDNDFDDAVFIVEADPWNAISYETPAVEPVGEDFDGDGILDHLDVYPLDAERAFINYAPGKGNFGTIAFEDMWPRLGDYDFNDMVVDYSFVEILDAKERVKDIELSMKVRAMGGSQNHGFAMRIGVEPSMIESVSGQQLNDDYIRVASNGTEQGMSKAIIPMFTDGFALFDSPERGGIINTDPTKPEKSSKALKVTITFREGIDREVIGSAPYDPFMLRSQDRGREIHLAGNEPTENADMSGFNTEADASNFEKGYYFVDENNLPWAIHVPESFIYPQEQTPINKVYENFADWATYGGESSRGWFRNTVSNVNLDNGF